MTSILADRQYTLGDFKEYELVNGSPELDQDIINKINRIAKRVGAPSYQKTPVFKRHHHNYSKHLKKENLSSDDWESIRNFKTTKLEKNTEGIEVHMDKIRSSLNKLTDKTYDIMIADIIGIMEDIEKEGHKDSFVKIGETIFEIGSFNKFWSSLYARLYKDLMKTFPFMKDICIKNFQSFSNIFEHVNYMDANKDYNLFCEYNKENEKRRALSNFFVICANYNIIDKGEMSKIIVDFIEKVKTDIKLEDKVNTIEEIVHNLAIMIPVAKGFLKELGLFNTILRDITDFSIMNHKSYPSLSSKIVFKFLDLSEELED
jgi:hypothetical protein